MTELITATKIDNAVEIYGILDEPVRLDYQDPWIAPSLNFFSLDADQRSTALRIARALLGL